MADLLQPIVLEELFEERDVHCAKQQLDAPLERIWARTIRGKHAVQLGERNRLG